MCSSYFYLRKKGLGYNRMEQYGGEIYTNQNKIVIRMNLTYVLLT